MRLNPTRLLFSFGALALSLGAVPPMVAAQASGAPEAVGDAGAERSAVVLLAPAEVRAEWAAALQIELATRGAVVIAADVPDVETTLLGDAEAQRLAITRGALAAIWAEAGPGAWRLRLVRVDAERARVVPVNLDVDPRTVALIVVSLLDGSAEPSPVLQASNLAAASAQGAAVSARARPAELTDPSLESPDASEEVDPAEEGDETPAGPHVRWSGRVGLAAIGFADGVRFDGGPALRAGMAMRYDWFELSLLHDLGFYYQQSFGAVQPFGRACLETGGATARDTAAFHAGVRGCFGSVFATEVQPFPDSFVSSGPRTHLSGGFYLAASFALTSWIRLFVRGELDIGWTHLVTFDRNDFVPSISTFLSFS